MLYNVLSQERPHTRPSRYVGKGGKGGPRKPGKQERYNRNRDVMTFSVDLPGFSDERGSTAPVYVADRFNRPQTSWTQPVRQPVSPFDTDRRRAPLVSRDGLNLRVGIGLLLALLILMLGTVAISYGQISSVNREVNTARDRISSQQEQCYNLEREIAVHASEINVTLSAVEMGMISARGVDVIYLTAPEAAVMSNVSTGMLSAEYLGSVFGE